MKNSTQTNRVFSAQPVIIGGFVSLLLLLVALFAVWYKSVEENKRVLATTTHLQSEMRLIYQMRDSASRRAVYLLHMAQMTDDPFAVDAEYMRFKEAANPFMLAQEKLTGPGATETVLRLWKKTRPSITQGGSTQIRVAMLLLDDELAKAQKAITDEVLPTQDTVMAGLDNMLHAQQHAVDGQIIEAQAKNHRTDVLLLTLAGIITLVGSFIAAFVIRRSAQSEAQLREQSDRIRSLYDVSSISGLSLDEQISEMLRLGCQLTRMQTGSLLRLNSNNNEVINTINSDGITNNSIGEYLLTSQFCIDNSLSDTPLTVNSDVKDASSIPVINGAPLFTSYIGISLKVHGKSFGVLNFITTSTNKQNFNDVDKDLVTLIGSWMSVTLERILEQSELADAKDIAESANHAKSSFIANMSHEIRTPLTAIIGFANSLLDPSRTAQENADAAHTIVRSSQHLHELINDILDLSKIEAGQLVVEKMPVSLLAIVAEVESVIAPRAREKGLCFHTDAIFPLPETIISDPTQLKQILLNLCSNATKFTSAGEITIITSYDVGREQVVFTVSDTGIGMDSQELTQIFKPFAQADSSTTRRFGGTGLGLWISQQLSEHLGGEILCESEKGKGSSFTVRVSIGDVQQLTFINEPREVTHIEKAAAETTSQSIPQLNGHILLAEDSPDIQNLVKFVVKKTGAKITVVDNGKKAVEQALANEYDLILMDMQMPEMGGIEATNWLRNAGYASPIVALTANAMKQDEEQGRAAGFDNYLTKPLVIDRFYTMLSEHISASGQPAKPPQTKPNVSPIATDSNKDGLQEDEDFQDLVDLFLQSLQIHVRDIATALENIDWDLLQTVSHKLKGSGAAFGYPKITELAGLVNDQLHKNINVLPEKEFLKSVLTLENYCKSILLKHSSNQ